MPMMIALRKFKIRFRTFVQLHKVGDKSLIFFFFFFANDCVYLWKIRSRL